jgi:hypothetical protein
MTDDALIPINSFNQNPVEHAKFMNYKQDHHITKNDLRDKMLTWFQANPGIPP